MNLSRWSLRYPITSSMVIVCIVVLGALAAPRLPLAFLPEVDFPFIQVSIPYPNSLPTQVEEEITRPAEEALATMNAIRRIQSFSNSGGSDIFVQFDWGEDIGPLRAGTFDECGSDGRGRQAHVPRHGDALRAEVRDEAAPDQPRRVLVDLRRIQPADVVGLEYGRIDLHSLL